MRTWLVASLVFSASAASAAMGLDELGRADGLAKVIANAEPCGYAIDEPALEAYFVANNMDDPETLSYISSSVKMSGFGDKPKASECTMSKATGKKIGVVK